MPSRIEHPKVLLSDLVSGTLKKNNLWAKNSLSKRRMLKSAQMESMTTLLIGYGSIGRHHARAIASLGADLVVVDSSAEARKRAASDYPKARVYADIAALEGFPWQDGAAVIATWGPSHAPIFHALADRGLKRILCEKPMATSVADAVAMVERAKNEGITFAVNHYLRYAGLSKALRMLFQKYDLGEPVAIRVEGGAAGLVTNGIHWIDFASELFEALPQEVVSTARGEAINPRSADLLFYQGTAIWQFPGDREAVISFTNRSSLSLTAQVFLRDAVVEFNDSGEAVLRQRDMEAVKRYPAITRTGGATNVRFKGMLPYFLSAEAGMQQAVREVLNDLPLTVPASVGAHAVSSVIGALLSARERRSVSFPVEVANIWAHEHWKIS